MSRKLTAFAKSAIAALLFSTGLLPTSSLAQSGQPNDPQYNYPGPICETTGPYVPCEDTRNNPTFTNGTPSATAHDLLGVWPAWNYVTGTAYLAIVDGGIQAAYSNGVLVRMHPDLAPNVRLPFSINVAVPSDTINENPFGHLGHGTHVAGLAGAAGRNGKGSAGVCHSCSLMIVRASDFLGNIGCTYAAAGLTEAVRSGAQVVNISSHFPSCQEMDTALSLGVTADVTVVAAAGNTFDQENNVFLTSTGYPASSPNVLAAVVVNATGQRTTYSVGGKLDFAFAAPGDKAFSTFYRNGVNIANPLTPGGGPGNSCKARVTNDPNPISQEPLDSLSEWGFCSGSSMASPMIAGSAALVRSANPLLGAARTKDLLASYANRYGQTAQDVGAGVPNVGNSVLAALYGPNGNLGLTPLFAVYNAVIDDALYTIAPQMARSALEGNSRFGNDAAHPGSNYASLTNMGAAIPGYSYPGASGPAIAAAHVFTTYYLNNASLNYPLLAPLYRLSRVNAGTYKHTYVSTDVGRDSLIGQGWALDGIEGYVYPANQTPPSGLVSLVLNGVNVGYACPNPLNSSGICSRALAAPQQVWPSGTVSIANPTYRWNASPGAAKYRLWVWNNNTNLISGQPFTVDEAHCPLGSGECSVTPSTALAANVQYGWYVKAENDAGISDFWSGWTVTYTQLPPPPGAAVGIAPSGNIATVSPQYSWYAVPGVTMYSIYVTVPGSPYATINQAYTPEQAQCPNNTAVCSVNPSTSLAYNTTYVWSVSTTNAGGSTWNNGMFFTTPTAPATTNWALASNGGVAYASSSYGPGFAPNAANDGIRASGAWGNGAAWNDATAFAWGDWLEIDFPTARTLSKVIVYTLQDDVYNPSEPTDTMTFTSYGITDFSVEVFNGSTWIQVGLVSNNNLVKNTFNFSPIAASAVRVLVADGHTYSVITELEAFGY